MTQNKGHLLGSGQPRAAGYLSTCIRVKCNAAQGMDALFLGLRQVFDAKAGKDRAGGLYIEIEGPEDDFPAIVVECRNTVEKLVELRRRSEIMPFSIEIDFGVWPRQVKAGVGTSELELDAVTMAFLGAAGVTVTFSIYSVPRP